MGDVILVRKPPSAIDHQFEPKAEEGVFLASGERTPGGARVMVARDGRTSVRVVQMPIMKDVEAIRWRVERGPQDQTVWVSTTGDVRWNAPPSDMLTVEESVGEIQPWNDGNTASDIIRERFKKHLVPEVEKHLFGLFGHGFLVTPAADDEPDGEVKVGVVEAERPNPENTKTRYVIYSNKVEQQMIKDETTSHRLMVTESADAGVFMNPSTPEWELNKWMDGLSKELDTMEVKNVLEKVPQSKFPNAKPVPSKLVLTKKPMEDSDVIIKSDMGASEVAALIQQAWNPRVRLVACRNFEKRRPTNMTAVVLDISCTWLIRDSNGEIQGAMVMYVDDALIIGDLEICTRLKAKLSSLWDLKVQGILKNHHMNLVVGET
ncbi:unnamed protein product, partial [Symbiodinium microadriaticum]